MEKVWEALATAGPTAIILGGACWKLWQAYRDEVLFNRRVLARLLQLKDDEIEEFASDE